MSLRLSDADDVVCIPMFALLGSFAGSRVCCCSCEGEQEEIPNEDAVAGHHGEFTDVSIRGSLVLLISGSSLFPGNDLIPVLHVLCCHLQTTVLRGQWSKAEIKEINRKKDIERVKRSRFMATLAAAVEKGEYRFRFVCFYMELQ